MVKEGDMSLLNDVLEPFSGVINTDPQKDKLSATTKPNFSDSNQSLKEGITNVTLGKRKFCLGAGDTTPDKRPRTESTLSTPVAPSPLEPNTLKIDVIAAKAQIVKLEAHVNHQYIIRKEMKILYEKRKASLVEQHKINEKVIAEMENRLDVIRRREQEAKAELNEAEKEFKGIKTEWDKYKSDLQNQLVDLKDKLLRATVLSKDQLPEIRKDMDEIVQAFKGAQSEVEMLRKEVAKQTSSGKQCTTLRAQLDKQTFDLLQATRKLKELEGGAQRIREERDSYKDWQQQAKKNTSHSFTLQN